MQNEETSRCSIFETAKSVLEERKVGRCHRDFFHEKNDNALRYEYVQEHNQGGDVTNSLQHIQYQVTKKFQIEVGTLIETNSCFFYTTVFEIAKTVLEEGKVGRCHRDFFSREK